MIGTDHDAAHHPAVHYAFNQELAQCGFFEAPFGLSEGTPLGDRMRFDLADLRLFLCVVDAGSITAGARQANLALASASERISNIESDAGVRLLERSRTG